MVATSPIVPLAVSVLQGDSPTALQWGGIAFALCGIVLVASEPPGDGGGAGGTAATGGRTGGPAGAQDGPNAGGDRGLHLQNL